MKPQTALSESLALLDMAEVVTGARLGSGGFCHVYEAKSFDLSSDVKMSKPQKEVRATLASNAKTTSQPKESSFAVKAGASTGIGPKPRQLPYEAPFVTSKRKQKFFHKSTTQTSSSFVVDISIHQKIAVKTFLLWITSKRVSKIV